MGASIISVGDKSVIFVDCANKTPAQLDEVKETLSQARSLMSSASEKSVYIVTDLTKSAFNPELVEMFSSFVSANSKVVRESIVVGLSAHHKVILSIFRKMYKREFHLADTMEDAKTYLMSANH